MNKPAAYKYLKQYGGLDFLFKHWRATHTDDRYYGLRDFNEKYTWIIILFYMINAVIFDIKI
ncbi:MAG: DUF3791 domain-containing protein [Dysgonamonadaceae bacterium]|nr:DUF3791 domain-containing protein [Dysgonamonadaceae bacterium]